MTTPPSGGLGIAGGLTRAFIASPLTPLFLLASLALGLIALVSLPREEEPQISVPMGDIHVEARYFVESEGSRSRPTSRRDPSLSSELRRGVVQNGVGAAAGASFASA